MQQYPFIERSRIPVVAFHRDRHGPSPLPLVSPHTLKELAQSCRVVVDVEFLQQLTLGQAHGHAMPGATHIDRHSQFWIHSGPPFDQDRVGSPSERLVYCAEPLFWRESAPSRKTLRMMRMTGAAIQRESAKNTDGPQEPHPRRHLCYSDAAARGSLTSLRYVRLPRASTMRINFDGRPHLVGDDGFALPP